MALVDCQRLQSSIWQWLLLTCAILIKGTQASTYCLAGGQLAGVIFGTILGTVAVLAAVFLVVMYLRGSRAKGESAEISIRVSPSCCTDVRVSMTLSLVTILTRKVATWRLSFEHKRPPEVSECIDTKYSTYIYSIFNRCLVCRFQN